MFPLGSKVGVEVTPEQVRCATGTQTGTMWRHLALRFCGNNNQNQDCREIKEIKKKKKKYNNTTAFMQQWHETTTTK